MEKNLPVSVDEAQQCSLLFGMLGANVHRLYVVVVIQCSLL